MTDAQIVFAINIGIGILSALLCYLMFHLLTRETPEAKDEIYGDIYKASAAIEFDEKTFNTVRRPSTQMAIDAVNKAREIIEKKGVTA